jgi:uncharacterized RDD family membrane protein YckC
MVAAVVAALLVFPPFEITLPNGVTMNMGYGVVFWPPEYEGSGLRAMVNVPLLLAEWGAVFLIAFAISMEIRSRDEAVGRGPRAATPPPETVAAPTAPTPLTAKQQAWRRFWASSIDIYPAAIIAGLLAANAMAGLTDSLLAQLVVALPTSLAAVAGYQAAWISLLGVTPGKWLLGVRIASATGPVSFRVAFRRSLWVLASGFWFLILFPVLQVAAFRKAYDDLVATGSSRWDRALNTTVSVAPVSTMRAWAGVLLGSACLIAMVGYVALLRQDNRRVLTEWSLATTSGASGPVGVGGEAQNELDTSGLTPLCPEDRPITSGDDDKQCWSFDDFLDAPSD